MKMRSPITLLVLIFSLTAGESAGQTVADSLPIKGTHLDVDVYGNMIVLDTERNMLRLYSKDRILIREIGGSGWENDQFDRPAWVWARWPKRSTATQPGFTKSFSSGVPAWRAAAGRSIFGPSCIGSAQ